jgi:hypothetical protein
MLVNNQKFSRYNESFGKMDKFYYNERDQCNNITALGLATGTSLNLSGRQSIE